MDQTTSLLINLPGQQAAQYLTLATGFGSFDSAIAGQATLAAWAGTYTLAAAEFLNAVLVIPALAGAATLQVSTSAAARPKTWTIDNTLGGYPVTVQVQAQASPPVIPAGAIALVRCNGTAVAVLALFTYPVHRDLDWYFPGSPGASAVVMGAVLTEAWTLPAGLAGSQATALTAASADAEFVVAQNGTAVGSITFHAAGAPTLVAATETVFAVADLLTVTGPVSPDADLAGLFVTLRGVVA